MRKIVTVKCSNILDSIKNKTDNGRIQKNEMKKKLKISHRIKRKG